MAFNINDKVRVADQSSEYRNKIGVVRSVAGDEYMVRLFGHGGNGTVRLLATQLRVDARMTGAAAFDYSHS